MAMLMVTAPAGYAPALMAPASIAPARATFAHMMADEPDKSFSAEILESAKDEEEKEFIEKAAKLAEAARSPDVAAAHRALAEAAVAALRDRSEVVAALEKTAKPSGKIAKALRKPSGSMALIGEGTDFGVGEGPGAVSLMGGFDMNDPTYLSPEFRKGGVSAICGTLAYESALTENDLEKFVAEQATAKGEFPGPVPVICRAPFIDPLQLAQASLDGALGCVLPMNLNDKASMGELMAACEKLGMEALVRVSDASQMADAIDLGAGIVVLGDVSQPDATELIAELPRGKNGIVTVADFPYLDVRGAWQVRDAGFSALLSGASMLEVCARDRVPPAALCKAILSKGSVKYGLGMQKGRLEGSKEFLGSLSM
jgi:hypothetical protein